MKAFPAYEAYNYYYNDQNKLVEQEKFLIVANLSTVINVFDKRPYKVWVKTDHTADEIESYLKEKTANTPRSFRSITSIKEKVDEMKAESLIKITNGLFTLDFLIALLLCVIGYLIHWITSIRDRELMFGIYRAMGISMGEINKMLSLEQMFMSLSPVLAGAGAGTLATILFAKIFAVVYLPEKHPIKLMTYISGMDMIRLGVIIGVAIIVCFMIIRRIIKGLKITEALKLGED
jgi:putative ABC transport system permease protein